jgi:hypothetical protein
VTGGAGNGGVTGGAGKTAGSGGVAGSAGKTAGSGGVTGGAGKTAGSGGVAGSAGKTAGSGGSAGNAAGRGEDAGAPPCAPCIEGSLSWGNIGGLVAFTERSTLDACYVYQHTRSPSGRGGSTMLACERSLPCMGSGLHGVSDVLLAIQNADVQAALAKGHVLFGNDTRPVDGTVFEIVARASTAIEVGSACSGGASCPAIPAGVSALADLLRAIDDEQLNLDPCRSMFRP